MKFISFLFSSLLLLSLCQLATNCQSADFPQGKNLYAVYCQNCHMEDGSGLGANIPPLASADYLVQNKEHLACIIRHGINDTIVVNGKTYTEPMAGNEALNDIQLTNLINYLHHSWGNDLGFVTVDNIREQLKNCK